MILSRTKPAVGPTQTASEQQPYKQLPNLDDFLAKRDYTGAITLLEFDQSSGKGTEMTDLWLGYSSFHLGDYKRALSVYQTLLHFPQPPTDTNVNLACCYFYLGMYPEAEKALEKAEFPENSTQHQLKTRLLFHLAHKLNDEKRLMEHHQQLQDIIQDQLSLASIHYLRSHYQEAIDIYKRILLDNRYTESSKELFIGAKCYL